MGRASSRQVTTEEKLNAQHTDVQQRNKKDDDNEKQMKILILGTGYSGKTTIMKQMDILTQNGYSEEKRECYKDVVFSNAIQSMVAITKAMKKLDIPYENPDSSKEAKKVFKAVSTESYLNEFSEVGKSLKALWSDSGIQECFERSREYQLIDNSRYCLDALERLSDPTYIPNEQDVLQSRVKTTGIIKKMFKFKNLSFELIDVGGARSERKKRVHCFQNVTAIIFCVGMSEYDQVLAEDEETNRMEESLRLFESICNHRFFSQTHMMLFLNKKDLFKQKLTKTPLNICFPDYTGENEYEPASQLIREQFEKQNNHPDTKEIYTHFVCATDTENVRLTFNAVFDVLLKKL